MVERNYSGTYLSDEKVVMIGFDENGFQKVLCELPEKLVYDPGSDPHVLLHDVESGLFRFMLAWETLDRML